MICVIFWCIDNNQGMQIYAIAYLSYSYAFLCNAYYCIKLHIVAYLTRIFSKIYPHIYVHILKTQLHETLLII